MQRGNFRELLGRTLARYDFDLLRPKLGLEGVNR